jgi:hypothetical protein
MDKTVAGSNRDCRRLNLDQQRPAVERSKERETKCTKGGFGEQCLRALFVALFKSARESEEYTYVNERGREDGLFLESRRTQQEFALMSRVNSRWR